MRHHNPGNFWHLSNAGLVANLDYGRYQKVTAMIPAVPHLISVTPPTLKEHTFSLANPNSPVILGEIPDTSDRLFLTTGVNGGFRGGVVLDDTSSTTCNVILLEKAANKVNSCLVVAAILNINERLVIMSWDRKNKNTYHMFEWFETHCEYSHLSEEEWTASQTYPTDLDIL